jgi:hypothetical protein
VRPSLSSAVIVLDDGYVLCVGDLLILGLRVPAAVPGCAVRDDGLIDRLRKKKLVEILRLHVEFFVEFFDGIVFGSVVALFDELYDLFQEFGIDGYLRLVCHGDGVLGMMFSERTSGSVHRLHAHHILHLVNKTVHEPVPAVGCVTRDDDVHAHGLVSLLLRGDLLVSEYCLGHSGCLGNDAVGRNDDGVRFGRRIGLPNGRERETYGDQHDRREQCVRSRSV